MWVASVEIGVDTIPDCAHEPLSVVWARVVNPPCSGARLAPMAAAPLMPWFTPASHATPSSPGSHVSRGKRRTIHLLNKVFHYFKKLNFK